MDTAGTRIQSTTAMMHPPPPRDDDNESLAANTSTAGDDSTSFATTTGRSAAAAKDDGNACSPLSPAQHQQHLRPILVGYAFGPKKMSTMGIIMAEASRAQLSTVVTTARVPSTLEQHTPTLSCASSTLSSSSSSHFAFQEEGHQQKRETSALTVAALKRRAAQSSSSSHNSSSNNNNSTTAPPSVVLSMSRGPSGGFRNIVRYFRSSCSSVASDDTLTTATTSTTNQNTLPMHHACCSTISDSASSSLKASSASSHRTTATTAATTTTTTTTTKHPVRVSFVPLDLDSPLEEQHGGNFDVILHKLTEDILCLSTLPKDDMDDDSVVNVEVLPNCKRKAHLDETQLQAISRVDRLEQYQRHHPQCSMVDHPSHVQILMSRSDISRVLDECLVGVKSASGMSVKTPAFEIYHGSHDSNHHEGTMMQPPLIAKPLTAAGTKKSHCMGVVLHPSGLQCIQETPCLLQEYVNHNAILHKVYVMGDQHVSVFERPSLPNLPLCLDHAFAFCEFDSQRPYPTLEDFGIVSSSSSPSSQCCKHQHVPVAKRPKHHDSNDVNDPSSSSWSSSLPQHVSLTVEEIRPVVNVLKQAFGLELFGFDVLVTMQGELLVVDVNYFPSYKEVSNFPSLLANYLTQRAIDGRLISK